MDAWQELLIHLFKDGRKWLQSLDRGDWRRDLGDQPGPLNDPSINLIKNENEAQNWIRNLQDLATPNRKGFVISPGKHGANALTLLAPYPLALNPSPRISLQLGVLQKHDQNFRFFGYRFESPEIGENHNYYHAQPIQAFGRGAKSEYAIDWYPDNYPTFPIHVRDCLELVVAVLISFRGLNVARQLASSREIGRKVRTPMQGFIDHLRPS
ncbi:MAG: hypothetical protein JAY90_23575 [Candidatus Thiodiazotropha lotti]|nr:hypothetical protein [Candidatus Thiodiazotropha lotti]